MNIISIDGSTKSTGIAYFTDKKLVAYDCFTASSSDLINRIYKMSDNLKNFIKEHPTDKIILETEGFMSISNNGHNELVITCKTGPNTYKKNYVYLNAYTMYVVEDITGTHTDPYHYKLYFHTEFPIDIETKP